MAFDAGRTPGRSLVWQGVPEHWSDLCRLGACLVSYVVAARLPLAGRLCGTDSDAQHREMRSLPWRPLCEHVCVHGSRAGAPALTTVAELRAYLDDWSAGSVRVRDTLKWRYSPSAMRDISRLGAWLGDTVHTELCVRTGSHHRGVKWVVVNNENYKELGTLLEVDTGQITSANNMGNMLEHLMWLALEEHRCEWILGVLRCLGVHGTATDGASAAAAAPREGGLRLSSLPGASQPGEKKRKKRRDESRESSDSKITSTASWPADDDEAPNEVQQRETQQRRHVKAEARVRRNKGRRLALRDPPGNLGMGATSGGDVPVHPQRGRVRERFTAYLQRLATPPAIHTAWPELQDPNPVGLQQEAATAQGNQVPAEAPGPMKCVGVGGQGCPGRDGVKQPATRGYLCEACHVAAVSGPEWMRDVAQSRRARCQEPQGAVGDQEPAPVAAAALATGGAETVTSELRVGDVVYRGGHLATVIDVDHALEPPGYVVRMAQTGAEVSTEGHRLQPAGGTEGIAQDGADPTLA